MIGCLLRECFGNMICLELSDIMRKMSSYVYSFLRWSLLVCGVCIDQRLEELREEVGGRVYWLPIIIKNVRFVLIGCCFLIWMFIFPFSECYFCLLIYSVRFFLRFSYANCHSSCVWVFLIRFTASFRH